MSTRSLLRFTGAYVSNLIAFGIAALIAVAVYFVVLRSIGGLKKEDVESISPRLARKLKLKD